MSQGKSAKNYLRRMHHSLEGCDWCCGGGNEVAAELMKLTVNEAPPCAHCQYYDVGGPDMLCSKCRSYTVTS